MLAHPAVLGTRVLPRSKIVAVASIIGFAFATAFLAQWEIPLGFTPVPITGQTLGVVLAGAALGSRNGAASMLLYWILGAVGLPFYAGGGSGWETATGSTAGYLVGFVVAAWLIGKLAETRQDRHVLTAIPAILAGSVVIYLFGVSWLMFSLDVDLAQGLEWGFTPFVVGDLIKVAAGGTMLPGIWKLVGEKN
ncbi:MAG: biotin transporter BioY [Acidimicrobiia bacterium]|nr:biotin transporter BioY [Acidimicrobiia bacterium]